MRKIGLGCLVVICGVGCGETARRSHPTRPPQNGGEGGQPIHGGPDTPSDGGAGDVFTPGHVAEGGAANGGAENPGGAGGAGGAGGELPVVPPGYGGALIPALLAPTNPLYSALPTDLATFNVSPLWISADGSRVFGLSRTTFSHQNEPYVFIDRRVFTWTAAGGTQLTALPKVPDSACVADDGSAAIFTTFDNDSHETSAFRWTTETATAVRLAGGVPGSRCALSCNGNLTQVVFSSDDLDVNYLWALGQNGNQIVKLELPAAAQFRGSLKLSRDSLRGALTALGDVGGAPAYSAYTWTLAGGGTLLGAPLDQWCEATLLSGSGDVIAGRCEAAAFPNFALPPFRWHGGVFTALGADTVVDWVSRDGGTLFGHVDGSLPRKFAYWLGDAPTVRLDVDTNWDWRFVGASDDGKVAFLSTTGFDQIAAARRWTLADGLTPLPSMPGTDGSLVTGFSADGSLAVGEATPPGIPAGEGKGKSVAVLWDAQGPRDILSELTAAHVDLHGAKALQVDWVWRGATIRILGSVLDPDKEHPHAFVAELPLR